MTGKTEWFVTVLAAVGFSSAQPQLLIAWDSGRGTNYAYTADGISGNLYTDKGKVKTDGNSTDGTYGSEFAGAETDTFWSAAVGGSSNANDRLSIRIVNNTANRVLLGKIHFDAGRAWAGSPNTITLVYEQGRLAVDSGTLIQTVTGLPQLQGAGNPGLISSGYGNFDWSVTGLDDYTLVPGEEAVFTLVGSNASGTADTYIDNLAVSGVIVPNVLIAWDSGAGTNYTYNLPGVSGNLYTALSGGVKTDGGSTDGTFGWNFSGAATSPDWAVGIGTNSSGASTNNILGIRIVNGTGRNLILDKLHFDASRSFAGAPDELQVMYHSGDLDAEPGTSIVSVQIPHSGKIADYAGFDLPLTGLPDYVLADGQEAVFRLIGSGATGGSQTYVDNIAISGETADDHIAAVHVFAGSSQHCIRPLSIGVGFEYSWEADRYYEDGQIAHMFKDIGISSLRWPGGTVVTFSHWDSLTGNGWMDDWNPQYDPARSKPSSEFMDVDEYLDLTARTGTEIVLGINMSSGKRWNREADGVDEARRLVQHCKDRGFDVRYIYLDNESYIAGNNYNLHGEGWTAQSYAESFNLYAAAIKEVFPNAKLIANWRPNLRATANQSDVQTIFSIAGSDIDYLDLHWYWSYQQAEWSRWKSQLPMKETQHLTTFTNSYEDAVVFANDWFASVGYPHIRLAVLEWNISNSGPWTNDLSHTNFKTALMQSEMQMQFMQGGLDFGIFYAVQSPLLGSTQERHLISTVTREFNATPLWMWLYSKAAGKTVVHSSSAMEGIYTLAVKGEDGELLLYMLNKLDSGYFAECALSGYAVDEISETWRFADDGGGRGVLKKISPWQADGKVHLYLPPDTLTMIGFNDRTLDSDGDGIPDAWERRYFGGPTHADASAVAASGEHTVYEAYVAGWNPHDPDARLELRAVSRSPDKIDFSWFSQTGRNYRMLRRTDLLSGDWQEVSGLLQGSPGKIGISVPFDSSPVFYKLEVSR